MRIYAIQNNNQISHPNFKMKITPSESVKHAVLTSRDLMEAMNKEQNREFVLEFCKSLVKILKSNQADRIWATMCRGGSEEMPPSYVKEHYTNGKSKEVLWLDSIQKSEHKYGHMMYSQEGGNTMRLLIEYAKSIKDVPEQNLELTDEELTHYAYKLLGKDLHDSIGGFYYCM